MSIEVGAAFVTLVPSAKGFGAATTAQLGGQMAPAGKAAGGKFGGGMLAGVKGFAGPMAALVAGLGIASVVKSSLQLRAEFSKTMATMGAVAGVPKAQLAQLSDLAMQMGADTVFSANEAADAMLELAKGGLTAATIQGGALQGTLTLAAAGGTDMATAATIASNALNTFKLRGQDMNVVAAALAGGANASTASIESLGQALQQVGPGAAQAGLSVQETVAALAAFDSAGIKGSDAGTSLKTMLQRLVPQTDKARGAMADLGLKFTDAQGNFLPLRNVADQLNRSLSGLSDAQRTTALNTIFGSDASRAAAVLMEQGAAGVDKYVAATSDLGAAQRVADANMSGLSGSLEKLSGSWDTAKLKLGEFLEPAAMAGAAGLSKVLDGVGPSLDRLKASFSGLSGGAGGGAFAGLIAGAKSFGASMGPALTQIGGALKSFGAAMLPTLKSIGTQILAVVGPALRDIGNIIRTQVAPAFAVFLSAVTPVAKFLLNVLGSAVVGVIKGAVNVIKGALTILAGLFKVIGGVLTGNWSQAWEGIKQVVSGAFTAIKGAVVIFLNLGVLKVFRTGFALLRGLVTGAWAAIRGLFSSGMSGAGRLVTGGLSAIGRLFVSGIKGYIGMWRSLFSTVIGIVRNGWQVLRSAFGGALAAIRTVISTGFAAARSAVSSAMSAIRSAASSGMSAMRSAISSGVSAAVSFIRGLPGRARSALGSLGGRLTSAGADLVRGFIRGAMGQIGAVVSTIRDMASRAVNAAKSALGINSPSKVFAELGDYSAQGYAVGVERNGAPAGAAERMAQVAAAAASRAGVVGRVPVGGAGVAAIPGQRAGGGDDRPVRLVLTDAAGRIIGEVVDDYQGRELGYGRTG